MMRLFFCRLIRAMMFSPKIVLDCSYDNQMDRREAENAAKQLMLCFAENRAHDDPFDLHYCNVNLESACMKRLQSYIPTMLNPEFPMNIHSECFTEIFPKDNIVYLTPVSGNLFTLIFVLHQSLRAYSFCQNTRKKETSLSIYFILYIIPVQILSFRLPVCVTSAVMFFRSEIST